MSLGQQVRSGILWSALSNVGGQLIFALVFFVLARLLEPSDFGLVAYAAVFASFFGVFLKLGYSDALVQAERVEDRHLSTVFWASSAVGIILAVLCAALAYPIASITDEPRLLPIIQTLSLASVLGGFKVVPAALLLREMRFKESANRALAANLAGGGVGLGVAFGGGGVWALVAQRLVVELVGLALVWSAVGYVPRGGFSLPHLKSLTRYSNHVFGLNLVNYADQYLDQLLIGIYLNKVQLGYYAVGRRLSGTLSITMLDTFRSVSFPMFSKIQHKPDQVQLAVYRGTSIINTVTFPIYLGLAVLSPEAVAVAFGDKWAAVTELLWAFCLLGLYSSSMIMFIGVCKGTGHPGYVLVQRVISVILNTVIFVCVVRFGIFWVAVSFALRAVLTSPFQIWLMRRASGISYSQFIRALMSPAATSTCSVGLAFAMRLLLEPYTSAWQRLLICALTILTVHLLLVWRFSPNILTQFKQMMSARNTSLNQ